ncbi:MAG TPA: right-handed parallel beta-helix repeat-containing protein, partial [Candidatus Hydrogenedentes bacterium]|nr:right-handed parallel beta-helix repeat-containing protein [Candidatus Hydrogenedentota bacterium]
MARWMLVFAVVGACFGAVAEGDTVRVPADRPTLPAAVEAAPPGATVELAAGRHLLPAGLRITKPLRIKGESAETTVIQTTVLEGEALLADKVDGFTLEGVTVEYTGPAPPDGRTDFPSLLSVAGGRADVSNCVFRNSAGFGVIFKEGVTASLKKSRVEGSSIIGVYVKGKGTSVALEENSVHKSGADGIGFYNDAAGTIRGNICAENGENGITVSAAISGEVPVSGNTCEKNRWDGIRACIGSKVRIE